LSAPNVIDYYFAPMSGYAYLGHARLLDIAADTGAVIRYHPLDMAAVFAAAGSFPPAKYPEIRQTHRKADMKRWAVKLELPINTTPAFWPVPMDLACRVIVASQALGGDQGEVVGAILKAVWVHDLNISDQGDVGKTLELDGIVADEILNVAGDSAVASQAKAETAEAIEKGIFGSPTYVIGDDWFFGQDRLAFLRGHLKNL
jgi:2-hydroxychromene-2-carboxylate isomerase|tara:strand:- start:765 stop:1370 length:606 start_codon:yes stop_codon:yes gene_type:complete